MEYKEFISKLYIKGAGSKKAELTENLFLSAVNDTSVITDKRDSKSVYKGYNRGNPINEIAYDVINNNLNQSGTESRIEVYLNNMQDKKSENVRKICDRFMDDIPDITPENISNRIATFFIEKVLKPAAQKCEKTNVKNSSSENNTATIQDNQKGEISADTSIDNKITSKAKIEEPINPQIDDSSNDGKDVTKSTTINSFVDNHIEDNRINMINNLNSVDNTNENFTISINLSEHSTTYSSNISTINACIIELTTILNNLLRAGKAYAKNVNNSPPSKLYTSISGWEELSNWFDKYQELNTNLESYYEIYECPLLEPALPFKDKFNIHSFWRCHSTRESKSSAILGDITKYKNVLKEILKTIEDGDVK